MDKLASVLKLAKEIVALLEAPTAIKKPTPQIIAAGAAAAAVKVMNAKTKPAKSIKPVKPA